MNLSEITIIDPIFNLVPLVVLLPLTGIILNLLFGRRWGEKGAGGVASLSVILAFVVGVLLATGLARNPHGAVVPVMDWITVGDFNLSWAFRVDTLSVTMLLVVTGVGSLIHIYATSYMHSDVRHNGDPDRYSRFFVFFNLFIMAMLLLVTADNFLMLFVGWEGVGLCSYLLIGFWFEKGKDGLGNARAAKKAFVVNRVGDFGLLLAIFLIYWNFGTLEFGPVFEKAPALAVAMPGLMMAITLFMLLGVTGKSAQLPLFVWLPDAMAGPTPVSALIHAATMVTAGVYLVARSNVFYSAIPAAQSVVAWVGVLTAFFAATIAVGQNDIKKVLAYSTISQLGFMVAAVGMGAYVAGIFHLITHAFFKALLFLSAGSVILGVERGHEHSHGHAHGDEDTHFDPQDMRNMGGLQQQMPTTFWVYVIGALALAGIAPLAGFFSKDEILVAASKTSPLFFGVLAASAFLTAFYMGRQVFLVFFGKPRTDAAAHASESPALITVPLIVLAGLSILGGGLNLPGIYTLEHWLEHTIEHALAVPFSWVVALTSLVLAVAGIFLAWMVYGSRLMNIHKPDPLAKTLGGLFRGMENKWWVDELYGVIFVQPYHRLANFLANPVDLGVVDGIGNGIGGVMVALSQSLRRLQNGFVRTYTLMVLVGVVAILTFLVLR